MQETVDITFDVKQFNKRDLKIFIGVKVIVHLNLLQFEKKNNSKFLYHFLPLK